MTIKFRKIEKDDYPEIVKLYNKYFQNKIDIDDRKNFYDFNPLIDLDKKKYCRGFIALKNDKIVGHIAAIPFEFNILDKKLMAYSSNSLITEEKYRLLAPILCKKFTSLSDADFLINLTASKQAHNLFKSFGFSNFNNKKNLFNSYYLTNNKFLKEKVKEKKNLTTIMNYIISIFYLILINFFIKIYYKVYTLNNYNINYDQRINDFDINNKINLTSNVNFLQISSQKWHFWRYHRHEKNGNYMHLNIKDENNNLADAILIFYPFSKKVRLSELYCKKNVNLTIILIILTKFIADKGYDLFEYKFNQNIKNIFLKIFTIKKKFSFNPNMYKIIKKEKFDNNIKIELDNFIAFYSNGDKIV